MAKKKSQASVETKPVVIERSTAEGPRIRNKGIRTVRVGDLESHSLNFRTHPEAQRAALSGAVNELGWFGYPDVYETETGTVRLIDGHLRKEHLIAKYGEDATIEVNVTDFDEKEALKALATKDPLTAMAQQDDAILGQLLASIETEDAGLQELLDELKDSIPAMPQGEIVEDEVPEPPKVPVTKPGDLWVMGEHRLLCGDSTKKEDVERLMGGEKASLVFTDPPYGMSFQSNMRVASEKFEKIEGDDTILTEWIPHAIAHSAGWVFVWTTWKVLDRWLPVVKPFGQMSNMVVWSKGGGGIGDLKGTFSTDYELAMVFNRGAHLCGKRIGSVWAVAKDAAGEYAHPTQKPVALAAEAIDKTTRAGAIVLDVFGGSGSTMSAAEQTERKSRMIEISPAYCDVIVTRWETLTGRKATLSQLSSSTGGV